MSRTQLVVAAELSVAVASAHAAAGALAGLHAGSSVLELSGAALAIGGAGLAAWLTVVTVLTARARRTGRASAAARAAPRWARTLVECLLVAGLAPAPAAHAAVRAPAVEVHDVPVVRAPESAVVPARPPAAPPTVVARPTPPPGGSATYVVRAGDNLWRIAAARLAADGRPPPERGAVARYWRLVIGRNRATLRSHDPDRIYPGESLVLPAVADPS